MQEYPIKVIIKALNISKRAYLYNLNSDKRVREKDIEKALINCFHTNKGNYGRPRLKIALSAEGINISEGKIARILKENNLVAKAGRNRKPKKYRKAEQQILQENLLLSKDMTNLKVNEVWSSDITEFTTRSGKLYLAGVLDAASRRLMGFHIASNIRQDIVHQAIKMALCNIEDPREIVFHSDRGSQYTSNATQKLLKDNGIISSMSRPGKPNDNQVIESLWNTMKTEIGSVSSFQRSEATSKLYEHAGDYYNNKRIHSGISYLTPMQAYETLNKCVPSLSLEMIIQDAEHPIKDASHS